MATGIVNRDALYLKFKDFAESVKPNTRLSEAFLNGFDDEINEAVQAWFTPAEIEALKEDGQGMKYKPEHNPVGYWLW